MPELLLPRLKREIEARLAELRPIVAEAERLAAAKEALLAEAAAESRRAAGARSARNGAGPQARNGDQPQSRNGASANGATAEDENGRAPRGANQTAILTVVEERPGVSVAEIASVTKIAKPTVATTVSKLKREGLLADEAGGVKLASRQPVTLSRATSSASGKRDDGVSDEEWEAARRDPAAA